MKKHIFFIVGILMSFSSFIGNAQNTANLFAIPVEGQFNDHHVSLFDSHGVIVNAFIVNDKKKRNEELRFYFYDSLMHKVATKGFYINRNMLSDIVFQDETNKYHLFSKKNKHVLFKSSITDYSVKKMPFRLNDNNDIQDMVAVNSSCFLRLSNKKNSLALLNSNTGDINYIEIVGGEKQKNLKTEDLVNYKSNDVVVVASSGHVKKGLRPLYISSLSSNGEVQSTTQISKKDDKNLLSADLTYLDQHNNMIVSGMYSSQHKIKLRWLKIIYVWWFPPLYIRQVLPRAEGIYLSRVQNGNVQQVDYIRFVDLNHFADNLSDHQKKWIAKDKIKEAKKNKKTQHGFEINMHAVKKVKGGYVLMGEVYEKIIRESVSIDGTSTSKFLGNEFSEVAIIKLNNNGQVIWDQSIAIDLDYLPKNLDYNASLVSCNSNEMRLVVNAKDGFNIVDLDANGTISEIKKVTNIHAPLNGGTLKSKKTHIKWWRGNEYVIYGEQKMNVNNSKGKERTETVQYLGTLRLN